MLNWTDIKTKIINNYDILKTLYRNIAANSRHFPNNAVIY